MSKFEWKDLSRNAAVTRETFAKIQEFLAILDSWRSQLNLIGPNEWERIWERHVLDCHQLRKYIPNSARILDIGSGAGFPGIVLAASATGAGHVTLIESNIKKSNFLQAVGQQTSLPISIIKSRIESLSVIPAEYVTARAVAPLEKLLEYACPALEQGAIALFHKGQTYRSEIEIALSSWEMDYKVLPNEYSSNGVILKISGAKRDRKILSDTRRRKPEGRRG